ncbi:hypothetical protein [Conexibacter sp. CPCC 206217]|uniref:hypothetical protein n=1 Tax=Conexibacter sp. CPCC 206217 TaxID=3064574 RepID=UPI002728312A|nr:hypothetical protein [Conexibacter sp. CPCC 206217]MDO8212546.1 hypothetical protein [Conexibacter sp. CPCC 206217]
MGDRARQTPLQWLLTALAVAWLVTVLTIQLLGLAPADIASSPDWVVDGRLARLLSSSLVIDDVVPLLQYVALAAICAAVLIRHGALIWWAATLAGHVGSALIAYAVIGIAIALDSNSAERAADDLDYGISCVLAAQLGVLCLGSVQRLRAGRGSGLDRFVIVASALALVFFFVTLDWFGIEHQFAFLLGAGVLWLSERLVARRAAGRRSMI